MTAIRFIPGLLTFCLFLFSIIANAQQKISGKVSGENNLPLAGATITVKGTNISTISLTDGSFSINAKTGDILEISFVGYKTQQIKISTEATVSVTLQTTIIALDDVFVTGYTTQKVKEITGSVAIVKSKELTAIPAGQAEQMLQGKVAGLNIISSGMPGGASNVRLHGIGNFGDVTPLYIIDGVQGNINNLNPNDIESIQVLKDAGAYSIYGVRGANGVFVITTKSGKPGKATVLFSDIKGFTHVAEKLSAQELVKEIDTYFSAFDTIILKFGLEKIKTIGDAYIAAGGLPEKNAATAQNVVKAAIAMQLEVEKLKQERASIKQALF